MSNLSVTAVGRAVARAAFLPSTAEYYFDYFRTNVEALAELLEAASISEREKAEASRFGDLNEDLSFVLFHMCYTSPEFHDGEVKARRFLPYPLQDLRESKRAKRLRGYLSVQPWNQGVLAVNAADISADWIVGTPLEVLESRFEDLRGGMIRDMLRTASSHLGGLADVLSAATSQSEALPEANVFAWCLGDQRSVMLRLIRRIHQYARQSVAGVPDDALWMADVSDANGQPLISRRLAMKLRELGLKRLEDLLDRGRTNVFLQALGNVPDTNVRVDRIRQAAERARLERTKRCRSRIEGRLPACDALINSYFEARGKEFEDCLEDCLRCVEILIVDRDDEEQRKPRFPDFVIQTEGGKVIVIECKSSQNGRDIALTGATDVGGKAALHGLSQSHLITICQKYVSTDVPRQIESQSNLSVINAEDLAVAMAYLKTGSITSERFVNWITTPGQPRVDELT